MKKDVVVGLGEIGSPILKLFSKKEKIVGYDLNKKLMDETKFNKFDNHDFTKMCLCLAQFLIN